MVSSSTLSWIHQRPPENSSRKINHGHVLRPTSQLSATSCRCNNLNDNSTTFKEKALNFEEAMMRVGWTSPPTRTDGQQQQDTVRSAERNSPPERRPYHYFYSSFVASSLVYASILALETALYRIHYLLPYGGSQQIKFGMHGV